MFRNIINFTRNYLVELNALPGFDCVTVYDFAWYGKKKKMEKNTFGVAEKR